MNPASDQERDFFAMIVEEQRKIFMLEKNFFVDMKKIF